MAVSVTVATRPDFFAPVKTELWYKLTSASYTLPNWRYYIDLYICPVTNAGSFIDPPVGRYKIPARPVTGEGIFSPHKILSSYVNYHIDPIVNKLGRDVDMMIMYNIRAGWGYNPVLTYGSSAGSPSLTGAIIGSTIASIDYPDVKIPPGFTFGGSTYSYLKILINSTTDIAVGDKITISKALKGINSHYDGVNEVIGVSTSTYVNDTIELKTLYFADTLSSDLTSGIATYDEYGDVVDLIHIVDGAGDDPKIGWNASRQYEQKGLNFYTDYQVRPLGVGITPSYSQQHFLSNWDFENHWKKTYLVNDETINMFTYAGYVTDSIRLQTYDTTGSFYPIRY